MTQICSTEGCTRRATKGWYFMTPLKCKQHMENGMKPHTQICKCGKVRPSFGMPDDTRASCCAKCRTDDMVDIVSARCKCGKSKPNFGLPDDTRASCCAKCKTEDMVDIVKARCKCGKSKPSFGLPDDTRASCCAKCKSEDMVDIVSARCKCGKSNPSFGLPDDTRASCCANCRTNDMVDIAHAKCKCGKSQPVFGLPDDTRASCCAKCKSEDMIDIVNARCLSEFCDISANKKYRNYCTACFQHLFPLDPLTLQIRTKTKEIAVRDFINEHYTGFQHDTTLDIPNCDCTIRRRIDHRKLINNTLLCIETDENQHKGYKDEFDRYYDTYMAFAGKWIWIRFNPDKYRDANGDIQDPELALRFVALKKEIDRHIERIENDEHCKDTLIEVHYMYYDENVER